MRVHDLLTADLTIDENSALPDAYVDRIQLSEQVLSRSELLRELRSTHGRAQLAVRSEAFLRWARFDMTAAHQGTPADLAELLRVASYLIDNEGTLVAARRLAAAIRAPLRATVRLLRTMPDVRLPSLPPSLVPPYNSLRAVIAALATLSHDDVTNVLLHLHPLELVHLPHELLRAGLARYATQATSHPLDLRDPLFLHHIHPALSVALPLWRAQCNYLLHKISQVNKKSDRPRTTSSGEEIAPEKDLTLAALKLSYVSAITSETLQLLSSTLCSLQILSPAYPAHVSFLRAATRLTELSLVSACPPEGSLLSALATLPLLETLEVVLPRLSPGDSAVLCASLDAIALGDASPACCSHDACDRAAAAPPQLAVALAGVKHAHLRTFTCDGGAGAGPAWPPMLAHFLPIPTLEAFTCHPYTLPRDDFPASPLVRAAMSGAHMRGLQALSLCWPDGWPRWGGRPPATPRERSSVSGADAYDVFTAAAAAMPQLRSVALDCCACDSTHLEPLLQLSHIQSLRLEDLQLSVASAATKWLQGLRHLRELTLGLRPTPATTPDGDDGARERVFRTLMRDLHLQEMPLTRLAFAEVPLTPATCAALGALSTLRALSWTVSDAAADAVPHSDTVAAFAVMLRACSALTAVRIPLWPRDADAGPLVAALVSLHFLRELAVVFHAPADPPSPLLEPVAAHALAESAGGSLSGAVAAPGAAHACLLALEDLHAHMTGGHGGHLVQFVERLNLQAPQLTALKLQCDEVGEVSQPHTLVRTLERTPHLQTLHLPGSCMQAAEDVAAVSPAICRLSALQELVFWGSVGVMGEAWRGVAHLPLCRGVVEVPLRAEE